MQRNIALETQPHRNVIGVNDKSTKLGLLDQQKHAFLPLHKNKPWLLVNAQ